MAKVYVAGKTQAWRTVREAQREVKQTGHILTYDWTKDIERLGGDVNEVPVPQEEMEGLARLDVMGVSACDLLIAIGHPNLCGTLWECGMALAWNKRIWLMDWNLCLRRSIFDYHSAIKHIHGLLHLRHELHKLKEYQTAAVSLADMPLKWDESSLD